MKERPASQGSESPASAGIDLQLRPERLSRLTGIRTQAHTGAREATLGPGPPLLDDMLCGMHRV
ncbi:MAG: hypothetical protein JXA57_18215, partial [Armatimonadetes bacterium]|nr:hypothetical protein [Armatimonadota bacterium]